MALRTRSEPDCSGMCRLRHDVGRLGHRVDHVVGEGGRVRAGEPDPLQALDLAAGAQQLAEGEPVAELHAVGVDVLAEQRHLDDALRRPAPRPRRGSRRGGGPSPCRAAPARCRTCRCCCSRRRSTPSRCRPSRAGWAASRGRPRATLEDLDLGLLVVRGPGPAAPAASRCCGCRRRRRPTAPCSTMVARSFWARQPPTAICMPGLLVLDRRAAGRGCRRACCRRSRARRRC